MVHLYEPSDCCRRGTIRHSQGDLVGALAEFDQAIAICPQFAEAWNNRGATRLRLGDSAGALADINLALDINPRYAEAYHNRGIVRQVLHAFTEALADFNRAVAIQPRYVEALTGRAATRQLLGDLAGALADFDRAIGIRLDHAEAYLGRAGALEAWGDREGALADYARVLEFIPRSAAAPVYHLRAGVFFRLRRFADSVEDCNQAIAIDPGLCMAYITRGNARYHLRDREGLADYWEAFQRNPNAAAADIIRFLAEDLRADAAAVYENCRQHVRILPHDVVAYARRGLSQVLEGKEAEAAVDLQESLLRNPEWKEYLQLLLDTARRERDRQRDSGHARDSQAAG